MEKQPMKYWEEGILGKGNNKYSSHKEGIELINWLPGKAMWVERWEAKGNGGMSWILAG